MNPCNEHRHLIDVHLHDPEAVDLTDETALHLESCVSCMSRFDANNPPWDDFAAEQERLDPARRAELLATDAQRPSLARWGFGSLVAAAAVATLTLAWLPGPEPAANEVGTPPDPPVAASVTDEDPLEPRDLLSEASQLGFEGRVDEALDILDELYEMEGVNDQILGAAGRLSQELELVGEPAGDLSSVEWLVDQGSFDTDDLTMVIFYEEWCPHCKREVPRAGERYEKLRKRGYQLFGITKASRTGVDAALTFIDEEGLGFPVGLDASGEVSDYFGVEGIPAAALVDDGVIIWRGHPARLTEPVLVGFLE